MQCLLESSVLALGALLCWSAVCGSGAEGLCERYVWRRSACVCRGLQAARRAQLFCPEVCSTHLRRLLLPWRKPRVWAGDPVCGKTVERCHRYNARQHELHTGRAHPEKSELPTCQRAPTSWSSCIGYLFRWAFIM